jgi:hypothetical protein
VSKSRDTACTTIVDVTKYFLLNHQDSMSETGFFRCEQRQGPYISILLARFDSLRGSQVNRYSQDEERFCLACFYLWYTYINILWGQNYMQYKTSLLHFISNLMQISNTLKTEQKCSQKIETFAHSNKSQKLNFSNNFPLITFFACIFSQLFKADSTYKHSILVFYPYWNVKRKKFVCSY